MEKDIIDKKILDLFCSNGSTWIDKNYFNNKVIKNDIRCGTYIKGEKTSKPQKIIIKPDYMIDLLNKRIGRDELPNSDIVYVDPPHIVNATGIMFETYGTLFDNWSDQLDNLIENINVVCNYICIFKWNDRSISVKNIIKKMEKYFIAGIKYELPKTHNKTFMILFIKKST